MFVIDTNTIILFNDNKKMHVYLNFDEHWTPVSICWMNPTPLD